MNSRKYVLIGLGLLLILPGCGMYNKVDKDIPIEQVDILEETYVGKPAWTRALIMDIGTEDIIDRDTKVEIVGIDLHWNGAVTVKGPNKRKVSHGLNLERPLTKELIDAEMNKLFWFRKPEYRYRMNLRKYGKKTAKAIFNHELFKGIKREAALESWGFPDEMKSNELGGNINEQWIYKDPRQRGKKSYIYVINGVVDNWEE